MLPLLALTLIMVSALSHFAQSPERVLIHEVGSYPCDGFRGTIDILLTVLKEYHPDQEGIVVNVGRGSAEMYAIIREEMIRSHMRFRGFDEGRVRFARSVDGEFNTQYFRVRKGGDPTAGLSRNYLLTSVVEPVAIEDYEFDALCPAIDYGVLFTQVLNDNPKARATILVRGKTEREAWRKRDEVRMKLVSQGRISPTRLQFFVTVKPDFNYGNDPYVEYRFIP